MGSVDSIYGSLPTHWSSTTIGELVESGSAELQTGPFGTMLHASAYRAEGTPVIAVQHIGQNRVLHHDLPRIDTGDAYRLARYRLEIGDILFGRKGAVDRRALIGPDEVGWIQGSDCIRLRLNSVLDPTFVSYVLGTPAFRTWIVQHAHGATMPSLNQEILGLAPLPVPPMAEQRAIAQTLRVLDDKIELNRRMNHQLEAMARTVFHAWFVEFVPVLSKLRGEKPWGMTAATAALFPSRMVNTDQGEIPEGWSFAALGDVVDVLETGKRPAGGVSEYKEGVPSIGAESIVGLGVFDYSKTKFVPRPYYDAMQRGRIQSRDILLYKDGGRPGEFEPHVTMFGDGFPFDEACINEHVFRIRARFPLTQQFLYHWLSSERCLEEMRMKGTGVAIPGLNSTAARSLSVLVPTASVIEAFTKQIEPMLALLLTNCRQSRTLARMRDTLMPKLLSGEVQVPAMEPEHAIAQGA